MTSERKINLVYNKFVKGNDTTNISSEKFYTNLQTQTSASDLCVYLTNGTNKELNDGGGGTTKGFQILSATLGVGNLFDVSGAPIVFDSKTTEFDKKIEILDTIKASDQIWDNSDKSKPTDPKPPIPPPGNGMYAGSVIRVNVFGKNAKFPVCGGYHINGIKLDMDKRKEVETNSVGLVKAYYTAIMNDFFTLATATPSSVKHYVLHLAQIPGDLYGGTEITGNAFHTAVTDWIASKTSVAVSMTISIDFVNPGSSKTSPAAAAAVPTPAVPTAAAATPSVSVEEIIELTTRLDESKSKLAPTATSATATADLNKTAALNIAQEIFNTFFGGGDVKTNQTKDFLIEKVTELQTIFLTDPTKKKLDGIMKRLDAVAIAPGVTATGASAPGDTSTSVKTKPMKSTKKYVFAFDIDSTLVEAGTFVAIDRTTMLDLMKNIIDVGHYVWIVTANNKITKDKFDRNYFTDKTITSSPNYYFMNPTTVDTELSEFFTTDTISPYVSTTDTALNLVFSKTDDGSDFQTKGLKPYAMIAKWLQLENPNMDDVQMYLFDDNKTYDPPCKTVKDGKIEFVKITPETASSSLSGFKSDVLTKATEKFEETKTTTKAAVTAGGMNLKVMTFNTWFHTFNATDNASFCKPSGSSDNECVKNNRNAVLDQMDKAGPVVIFLQEFSYDIMGFLESVVTIDSSLSAIESKANVFTKIIPPPEIKAFRHFRITYKEGRKFYVYIGQIGQSVMATIYSSELADESATAFFMGNLASGMNTGGDKTKHEIVPTFSGDNSNLTKEDNKFGIKGTTPNGYDFNGGSRPFTILRFDTLKLILLNIHSPHNTKFGVNMKGTKVPAGDNPPAITVAEFAFTALSPFFTKHVFNGIDKTGYTFVAGGDFNTDAKTAIKRLIPIFTDENKIDRTTNTCCVDEPKKTFTTTVDHIFSTSTISDYTVYSSDKLVKSTSGNLNYFSDHLPVYATVELPAAPSKTPVPKKS